MPLHIILNPIGTSANNATARNGIKNIIGNNTTIAAGAVVVKDVPEGATVGGVPAKVLNYNDNSKFVHNKYVIK